MPTIPKKLCKRLMISQGMQNTPGTKHSLNTGLRIIGIEVAVGRRWHDKLSRIKTRVYNYFRMTLKGHGTIVVIFIFSVFLSFTMLEEWVHT